MPDANCISTSIKNWRHAFKKLQHHDCKISLDHLWFSECVDCRKIIFETNWEQEFFLITDGRCIRKYKIYIPHFLSTKIVLKFILDFAWRWVGPFFNEPMYVYLTIDGFFNVHIFAYLYIFVFIFRTEEEEPLYNFQSFNKLPCQQ